MSIFRKGTPRVEIFIHHHLWTSGLFLTTFTFLLYILGNYAYYRVSAAAPSGVILSRVSDFRIVTMNGLRGGGMNIHICYDKI